MDPDLLSYANNQLSVSRADFHRSVVDMSYAYTPYGSPMDDPNYRQACWDAQKACADVQFWTNLVAELQGV